uniref:Uncharacterized protein n=1 Tax=Cacopsylla melanoneura TaxID=428564 RepID=A0A8D8QGS7_9HEMI
MTSIFGHAFLKTLLKVLHYLFQHVPCDTSTNEISCLIDVFNSAIVSSMMFTNTMRLTVPIHYSPVSESLFNSTAINLSSRKTHFTTCLLFSDGLEDGAQFEVLGICNQLGNNGLVASEIINFLNPSQSIHRGLLYFVLPIGRSCNLSCTFEVRIEVL